MKKISEIMEDILFEANSYYSVGDSIKFVQAEVGQYNADKTIGFDYGIIIANQGEDYIVRMDDAQEILVKNDHAYAFGNADATVA